MTAAVPRSSTSLTIPPTQNTAPVLEFRCLYTHDLRRKQKRWQDGVLRFHTFNKRVMVYDDSRNFIGDMHWKESEEVQDGDDVRLDMGVLVQVGEAMGTMETDLAPLFERPKKKGQDANAPSRGIGGTGRAPAMTGTARMGTAAGNQARHKSLSTLLGTSKGPQGKALLPTKSPFEVQRQVAETHNDERPAKRLRVNDENAAQDYNLVKTIKAAKSNEQKEKPSWARAADARTNSAMSPPKPVPKTPVAGQARLKVKEIIDITSTSDPSDNVHSDVTLPDTPPGYVKPTESPSLVKIAQQRARETHAKRKSPELALQQAPQQTDKGVRPVGKTIISQKPSTANAPKPVQRTEDHAQETSRQNDQKRSPPRNPRSKPMRLASGPRRNMLLSAGQSKSNKKKTVPDEAKSRNSRHDSALDDSRTRLNDMNDLHNKQNKQNDPIRSIVDDDIDLDFDVPDESKLLTAGKTQRATKKPVAPFKKPRQTAQKPQARTSNPNSPSRNPISRLSNSPELSSPPAFEEMALAYGRLDEQLHQRREKSAVKIPEKIPDDVDKSKPGQATRPFRRIQSENDARALEPPIDGLGQRVDSVARTRTIMSKRQMQRSKSLNYERDQTAIDDAEEDETRQDAPAFVKDVDVGPWSTEACDLFDWRPPGWDEASGKRLVDEERSSSQLCSSIA